MEALGSNRDATDPTQARLRSRHGCRWYKCGAMPPRVPIQCMRHYVGGTVAPRAAAASSPHRDGYMHLLLRPHSASLSVSDPSVESATTWVRLSAREGGPDWPLPAPLASTPGRPLCKLLAPWRGGEACQPGLELCAGGAARSEGGPADSCEASAGWISGCAAAPGLLAALQAGRVVTGGWCRAACSQAACSCQQGKGRLAWQGSLQMPPELAVQPTALPCLMA